MATILKFDREYTTEAKAAQDIPLPGIDGCVCSRNRPAATGSRSRSPDRPGTSSSYCTGACRCARSVWCSAMKTGRGMRAHDMSITPFPEHEAILRPWLLETFGDKKFLLRYDASGPHVIYHIKGVTPDGDRVDLRLTLIDADEPDEPAWLTI